MTADPSDTAAGSSDPDATERALADADTEDGPSAAELRAQVEALAEENERLRRAYRAAQRARYRRTAVALVVVGAVGLAGGALFPTVRTVLIALGGTGVFAGLVTYFLTPERFLPARIGELVYDVLAGNEADIVTTLGLTEHRQYVPTDDGVRLFVPQRESFSLPDGAALADPFVVTDDGRERGLALDPVGAGLYDEFERTRAVTGDAPADVAAGLADALIEQFELLDRADVDDVDPDAGRLTVGVAGSVYGSPDAFDHPVPSLLATGLAAELGHAVGVEIVTTGDDRYDAVVVCTWSPDAGTEPERDPQAEAAAGAIPTDAASASAGATGTEPEGTDDEGGSDAGSRSEAEP